MVNGMHSVNYLYEQGNLSGRHSVYKNTDFFLYFKKAYVD